MNFTTAQAQAMCQSQLRAIMSADDQFAATMQLLVRPRGPRQHAGDLLLRQRLHVGRARPLGEVRARTSRRSASRCWCAGPATSRPARTPPAWSPTSTCCPRCSRPPASPCRRPHRGSTASRCCSRPAAHDDVQRVLRRPRQPQHPLLADGPHADGEVRPDLQRRGRRSSPASTTTSPTTRRRTPTSSATRSTANDPPASTINNLTTRLNAFATCAAASCLG